MSWRFAFPASIRDPLLRWLYPKCRWIFSPWFLAFCLALVIAAIGLASFQFRVLQSKLPDFHAFITPQNIVWLFVALALVKIVHELAHALTCVHVGGRVPRDRPAPAGLHPLPLLRRLRRMVDREQVAADRRVGGRRHRRGLPGGRGHVSLVVQRAGAFHTLCLHIMIVCSVSTLLVERQSALPLRRLLRAGRLAGSAQPRSAVAGPLEPAPGRVLSRDRAAGRPLAAASGRADCWWPMPWFRPSTAG